MQQDHKTLWLLHVREERPSRRASVASRLPARDIAFQKIANRVKGTRMAAEKLGVS
jgi:hypothetical protein